MNVMRKPDSPPTWRYAGVGSRRTPEPVLAMMTRIAERLSVLGYTLLSGGADGADEAFRQGAKLNKGKAEIYRPWPDHKMVLDSWRGQRVIVPDRPMFDKAEALVQPTHPAWNRLSEAAIKLHSRNAMQCLGENLDNPVDFVVCWTPDGCINGQTRTRETGGTATAIVLAANHGIPVVNMARQSWREEIKALIAKLESVPF